MTQPEHRENGCVTPVPSGEILAVWPLLQKGLQAVRHKADPGLDGDLIFDRLVSSEAFLFLVPRGFFVLLPIHRHAPSVLIWIAYAEGGGAIPVYLPVIESLAREIGAEQIEIESPRPGYRRVFRDWQQEGQRYIRRLI